MFIRNGINSVLREKGRTALFFTLITFLTIAIMLSLSVLLYCDAMMNACEETYRSIALVEYMGSEYPDEDEPDASARKTAAAVSDDAILSVDGVTAWTRGNAAAGFVEGYIRHTGSMPYGNRGVIIVSYISDPVYQWKERDGNGNPDTTAEAFFYYTAILETSIYSRNQREGVMIDILPGDSGFVPEKGRHYVLNGSFPDTTRSASQIGDFPMNGLTVFRVESFFESEDQPYAECYGIEDVPEIFLREAEHCHTMNNYVRIVPCRDVRDVYVFHQNDLQLSEGSMPDASTPHSCVITADLAQSLDLHPDDSFTLSMLQQAEDDRYYLTAAADEKQVFTVSGIANDSSDYGGTVWAIADDANTPLFGYLLGTVSLINNQAEKAVEQLRSMMPDLVRVTLFDQGYNSAVQPFREVRKTSANVLTISSAGVITVLLLFAFLFIGRQKDSVKIMVSLGTPGRKIAQWFLSGALLICGGASAAGTVLAMLLRPAIISAVNWFTSSVRGKDDFLWYSETSVGMVKQMSFELKIPLWPNLTVTLAIILLAMMFCLAFLRLASRSGTRRKGRSRVRVPRGRTSLRHRGGLRFAILSIRRGGLRSLLVPLVSMVLTVTVITLSGMYQNWQRELDDAMDKLQVDGMAVSLNGTYYSNLALPVSAVRQLQNTEGITGVSVSFGFHYWLQEEMPAFGNGESGRWRREIWITSQPELVALNDLDAAKDFYYADANAQWLPGWDETMLAETAVMPLLLRNPIMTVSDPIPAVCSTAFLESHGLNLGDTLFCQVQYMNHAERPIENTVVIQTVGSYAQSAGKPHIYVPLSFYLPPEMMSNGVFPDELRPVGVTDEQISLLFGRPTFRTCRFHIASARQLEEVRQRLRDQNFSSARHISANRTTILLRDASFLKLKENMDRNIAIGRIMSILISLLIILIGFILSWLMTFSRRREFALMRGFGATGVRVFASFFMEQAILSLAGCLAGCLAFLKLYAGGMMQPLTVVAYLICYLLGTAVSIRMIGKTDLMELLTVRE